jgi:hypothetical protein
MGTKCEAKRKGALEHQTRSSRRMEEWLVSPTNFWLVAINLPLTMKFKLAPGPAVPETTGARVDNGLVTESQEAREVWTNVGNTRAS